MNGDNRFVFVTPMFNAAKYLPTLFHSICGQSYDNWRLILIDDVSNDENRNLAEQIILQFQSMLGGTYSNKIIEVWNEEKKWEVANVLHGIKMCDDNDIVCRIDADDWLTDLDALAIINEAYKQTNCDVLWTAHRWGYSDTNISAPMPSTANPYKYPWVSSHLKTFRKKIINDVNDQNFCGEDGSYIKRAGDQAIFLPVLHQTPKRVYLPRVMYHYTIDTTDGAVFQTDDAKFQKSEADFLRSRGFVK